MMSGMPLETCWSFNKRWNNKFYYKVAFCWLFLLLQKNTVNYTKNFQVGCGSWYIVEVRNIPGIWPNSSVPYDGRFIFRHFVRGSAVYATSGPNTCYPLDFRALISTEYKIFSKGSQIMYELRCLNTRKTFKIFGNQKHVLTFKNQQLLHVSPGLAFKNSACA